MRTFFTISTLVLCALTQAFALSLWNNKHKDGRSMFADTVAYAIGDQLEVIIVDKGSYTYDYKTTIAKATSINDSVTQWLFPPAKSGLLTHNGSTPAINMAGNNTYGSEWKIQNTQDIQDYHMSVAVTDVRPNGSLVISGTRFVSTAVESYHIRLIGTVRPRDIQPDNTIPFSKIAHSRFEIVPEGQLTEGQTPGFITDIYNAMHPF